MRITKEQRDRIAEALTNGQIVRAHRIAEEYGLGKHYIANLRWRLGLPLIQRKALPDPVKREDPRWQWAKQRGAISI